MDIPLLGSRGALWLVSELHLFLAAFILGAPMFIVACEYLGLRSGDYRYERLAKEMMRITAIAYSFTAITGGIFAFILWTSYQTFSNFLFDKFGPAWMAYIGLIVLEVILMYVYYYSWEPFKDRKMLHIWIGVALNVVGTVVMLIINGIGSYMLTPTEGDVGVWGMIMNDSWTGLNLHRLIANITFGGFIAALFGAFMFLFSRSEKEKAFYDWMGYIGTLIGVGSLMTLPLAGYIYAKELFLYSATISTFQMADKLAPFFVMQGFMITFIFIGINFYMWTSIKRIEGAERFHRFRTPAFIALVILGSLWMTPANLLPDIATDPEVLGIPVDAVLVPERMAALSLMMPKALAVTGIIIFTFLTYMIYMRALKTGRITWGSIAPQAQYGLIATSALIIYLMGLMGAIRELTRQDWHVAMQIRDMSPYWWVPPLSHTVKMTAGATVLFFAVLAFIFWVGFLLGRKEEEVKK